MRSIREVSRSLLDGTRFQIPPAPSGSRVPRLLLLDPPWFGGVSVRRIQYPQGRPAARCGSILIRTRSKKARRRSLRASVESAAGSVKACVHKIQRCRPTGTRSRTRGTDPDDGDEAESARSRHEPCARRRGSSPLGAEESRTCLHHRQQVGSLARARWPGHKVGTLKIEAAGVHRQCPDVEPRH